MRLAVFIKQVPGAGRVAVDPGTGSLRRETARAVMNPHDRRALDAALGLREKRGGEITAFSMGPPRAAAVLKAALAAGADRAFLLADPAFAGGDTLATATVLAAAVRHAGPFDVLLFGKHATDGDTAHVGPETAALLDMPSITRVVDVQPNPRRGEDSAPHLLRVTVEADGGYVALRVPTPCVLCVSDGCEWPRMAALDETLAVFTRKKNVETLDARGLNLAPHEVGLRGSPTRVIKTWIPEPRRACEFCDIETLAEKIRIFSSATPSPEPSSPPRPASPADHDIFVFGETLRDGSYAPVVLELLAAAQGMGRATLVVLDGASRCETQCADALARALARHKPACALIGGTPFGRAVAPRVAALLRTGLTADCTALELDPAGNLLQTRPAFGGNLMAAIATRTRPQIATVRPGVFDGARAFQPVIHTTLKITGWKARAPLNAPFEESFTPAPQTRGLANARVIVAGGRGMGGADGFALLEKLAAKLGGEVGASRAAVEAGWRDASAQVGQTGASVAPALYIAFGISGQIQHLAGIANAARVIAVNTDPEAEIFTVADAGIAADAREVARQLLKHDFSTRKEPRP
ncbi:MAG: FAD-binding protein [Kiritimatiellaeota bacterium]|nr:FAD-binding protein [Kiritimatiellota bacterium]